ncbi:hypothetical protein BsWGS_19469 [Bradybaena similaris]
MAESNLPKQDFAPPWLKFPSTDSSKTSSQNGYPSERNRQRREDPYHSRSDLSRLHRQTSFDFHDAKHYPPGQGKYRHHSIDGDCYNYSYGGYGYYAPSYNFEKFGMQYGSQASLVRTASREGKHPPGRFSQGAAKRGYYDKEHSKDNKEVEGKAKERNSDRDRPFSEDFPLLRGSGKNAIETKQTKAGSGVWDNPPKSGRNDESPKNTSPGIFKALLLSKNGQIKKNGPETLHMNDRNSSPFSASNRSNHKEVTRHSPTLDLTVVTQPKKLGNKKSDFLRALRNESSLRSGEAYQDLNQNSIDKKQVLKNADELAVNEHSADISQMNGSCEHKGKNGSHEALVNYSQQLNYELDVAPKGDCSINGEALIKDVDHIYLSGEEEEKRLLESMGWSEEDTTEYVITDDDVKEFHHMLNRVREQNVLGNSTRHNALRLKLKSLFVNGLLDSTYCESDESGKHDPL